MSSVADTFPTFETYKPLVDLAIFEDLGGLGLDGDATSRLTIDAGAEGRATVVQKAPGVACGLPAIAPICNRFDPRLRVDLIDGAEGRFTDASSKTPQPLATIRGPLRSLLVAERTVLNFLGHLGGVASLTRRFVDEVEGTYAKIYDTRKTLPGWRNLEKYAVRCGGGMNHRFGLFDMVLVKDNHLAEASEDLSAAVQQLVERSRSEDPARPIEIEVDTIGQFHKVLAVAGVDVILLDNMTPPTMTQCVAARDASPNQPALEASGGITLETVRSAAETGVERIALGALTHSAVNLDIGLDRESR